MCLGIPGRIISIDTDHRDLGEVEVAGATRKINLGILADRPSVGDWVLIQSGFAIDHIDQERARAQMELLNSYTGPMDDDGLAGEDTEFDWDTMPMTSSNSKGKEE